MIILFDVPMPNEYAGIATMRPLDLQIFACHPVVNEIVVVVLVSDDRICLIAVGRQSN